MWRKRVSSRITSRRLMGQMAELGREVFVYVLRRVELRGGELFPGHAGAEFECGNELGCLGDAETVFGCESGKVHSAKRAERPVLIQ